MFAKSVATTCLTLALTVLPMSTVLGQTQDEIAEGVIRGIVGSAVLAETLRRTTTQPAIPPSGATSAVSSASQAETREIQRSLAYFGFAPGPIDGIPGPRTRSAIAAYQDMVGQPSTGRLTRTEADYLLNAYHRARVADAAREQRDVFNLLK